MDKRSERLLRDALGALEGSERHYQDQGHVPAFYRLEPPGSEATVAVHVHCPGNDGEPAVTVKLGAPRQPVTILPCSICGGGLELHPPAEVLAWGRFGIAPGVIGSHVH